MKKIINLLFSAIALLVFATPAFAEFNSVTPSTNDINKTKGWAHVNQVSQGVGTTDLKFVNTRAFFSCFEYRVDNESNTVDGANPNTLVTDGRWTQVCLNNSAQTKTIPANEYVDVRMVYGAESDERFDWTRFDVLPAPFVRSAEITSPTINQVVQGLVNFNATLNDKDGDDSVQWAVRKGTCAAGTNTVLGNVDGFNSPSTWDHFSFHASADTSSWVPGGYCFIFNPSESAGDTAIRETREFVVADTKAPLVTINTPSEGETLSGVVHIFGTIVEDLAMGNYNIAIYPGGADFMDFSKRIEQSNVNPATIFNNQKIFEWDTASGLYPDGEYLIRFAARDAAGNRDLTLDPYLGGDDSQHVIKVMVKNNPDVVALPTDKNQCKDGGWKSFSSLGFKNQGACVSYVQSNDKAGKR